MNATTDTTTASEMTVEEMMESLTGYEEIAIAKAFGSDILALAEKSPTQVGRALVFVVKTREGLDHNKAKHAALSLTLREVDDSFADDEDEVMEEEPVTEQGEDDSVAE